MWLIKASHFDIENPSTIHVFSRRRPAHPSLKFYVDLIRKRSIWGPIQNSVGAKIRPQIDQVAPKYKKTKIILFPAPGGFASRPAFSETIVVTVPFGPSGFQKVISDGDWLIFSFLYFPCAMFYAACVSPFFHNTTKNVAPLSHLVFEKIAPPLKKNVFLFCFFARQQYSLWRV